LQWRRCRKEEEGGSRTTPEKIVGVVGVVLAVVFGLAVGAAPAVIVEVEVMVVVIVMVMIVQGIVHILKEVEALRITRSCAPFPAAAAAAATARAAGSEEIRGWCLW
jgi:hypothetical protein